MLLRSAAAALTAAFLTAGLCPPAADAAAGPAAPGLSWRACTDPQDLGTQCAKLSVPVDWNKPTGLRIQLPVARRPALKKRLGVLVIDFGGPGHGGADYINNPVLDGELSLALREHFDLVAMDTRDYLVQCSEPAVARRDALPLLPATEAAFRQRVRVTAALARDCAAHSPKGLVTHLDSVAMARDVDALRAALGEKKISFYGISYGTLIGQMYAEHFPKRLRALVLDSVIDHSADAKRIITDTASAEEDGFRAFTTWCSTHSQCTLPADLPRHVDRLFRAAQSGRLFTGTEPISSENLMRAFHGSLSEGTSQYGQLADYLGELSISAVRPKSVPKPQPRLTTTELQNDFTPLLCSDWQYDLSTLSKVRRSWAWSRAAAPHMRTNALHWTRAINCAGWPHRASNPQHALDTHPAPPALLLTMRHDVATPRWWAGKATEQMTPGSTLLTVAGAGHAVYRHHNSEFCVREVVDRYLLTGSTNGWPQQVWCDAAE